MHAIALPADAISAAITRGLPIRFVLNCRRASDYAMGCVGNPSGETVSKSLAQIRKEIEALQRQAEVLKQKETKDVIARIKEAIAHYGLTAADLGLAAGGRGRRGRPAPGTRIGAKSASKVKYRDDAGNTWSGHGRRPKWFIDAVANGKTPEQLAA